jgi:hypothetical protein
MNRETHEKLVSAIALLRSASRRMAMLEGAALTVFGPLPLVKNIALVADDLDHAADMVNEATGEAIVSAFHASEEATSNMIRLGLAIVSVKDK